MRRWSTPFAIFLAAIILAKYSDATGSGGENWKAARDYGASGSHSHMRQLHQHQQQQQQHRHHRPKPTLQNPKLLEDNNLVHDAEHMKEEMPKYLTPETIQNMSPREMDYHYFKLHDFNNDLRLDGLEFLAALGHVHSDDDDDDDHDEEEERLKGLTKEEKQILDNFARQKYEEDFKLYVKLIDEVFADNDSNKDGYISWPEYIRARRKN